MGVIRIPVTTALVAAFVAFVLTATGVRLALRQPDEWLVGASVACIGLWLLLVLGVGARDAWMYRRYGPPHARGRRLIMPNPRRAAPRAEREEYWP